MYLTRCPDCQTSVEFADDTAVSVRCPRCDRKILLRETAEEKEERFQKIAREARKQKQQRPPENFWLEMLPIFIAVPVGALAVLVTCVLPPFLVVTSVGGAFIAFAAMGKGCYLAAHDGNYVSFDYLGILGWFDVVLLVLFIILFPLFCTVFTCYILGYLLLWQVALIGCAIKNPRVYMPWLGLQAYGWVVFVIGFLFALIGEMVRASLEQTN